MNKYAVMKPCDNMCPRHTQFQNNLVKIISQKNIELISSEWKIKPVYKKSVGIKRFFMEIVEWIDALVWSIFTVLLVQLFVFQLYEIPSESMVDTFLVKDKVLSSFMCLSFNISAGRFMRVSGKPSISTHSRRMDVEPSPVTGL